MSITYKTILDLKQKSEISNADLLMIGNEGTGELRQITWQDAIKNASVDLSDYATKEEINELSEEISSLKEGGTGGNIVVDEALSETSTNPVQNKIVTKEIKQLFEEKVDKQDGYSMVSDAEKQQMDLAIRMTNTHHTNINALFYDVEQLQERNVQPDILQNDMTHPAYIKNNPFVVKAMKGNKVSWNGDKTGKTVIETDEGSGWVLVAEPEILPLEEHASEGMIIESVVGGNTLDYFADYFSTISYGDYAGIDAKYSEESVGAAIQIVYQDGGVPAVDYLVELPKKGIYFKYTPEMYVSSVTFNHPDLNVFEGEQAMLPSANNELKEEMDAKFDQLSEEIADYTVEGEVHLNLNDEVYVSGSIQDNGEELDSYYGAFKGMNYIPVIGAKTIEMYSETTSDIYIAQYDYRYKFISRTRLYSRNNTGDVVKSLTLDAKTRYIKVYRYTGTASEINTAKISVYYSEDAKNKYVSHTVTGDCTYVDVKKILGIEKNVHLYNCVQSVKSDGKLKDGDLCVTLGYYTENDGGGAKYLITSTSNSSNDIHQEKLTNGLYATLMHDGTINVKQLGAYGNNTKDDSVAFQKAFDLATKSVKIPTGNYLLKTSVLVKGKTNFVVHAEKSTIRYDETGGYCFKFTNIHNSDFYFGRIIGKNSNGCIELYSESNNTSVTYLNIYFQQFYSDTNCVYAHCGGENTQGGYIAEIRFFNGKVQAYNNDNYGVGFKIDNTKQNTMDHFVFTNIGIEGIHTGFYFIGAEEQVEDTGGKGIVEACEAFGFRAMEAFKILLKTDGLVRNTQFTTASYMYSRYFDVSEKTYGIKLNAPIMNTGGTRVAYSALIDNGVFIPFVEDDNTYHNITAFEEYDLNNSEDSFDTIYKYFLVNSTNKSLKLTNQYGVHSGSNKFYVKMDGIHDNGFTIFDYEGNVIFNNTSNLQAPCLLLFEWIENIGWLVTKVDTLTNVI